MKISKAKFSALREALEVGRGFRKAYDDLTYHLELGLSPTIGPELKGELGRVFVCLKIVEKAERMGCTAYTADSEMDFAEYLINSSAHLEFYG